MTDKTIKIFTKEKQYYFNSNAVYVEFCVRLWLREYSETGSYVKGEIESEEVLHKFNLADADKLKESLDKQIEYTRYRIEKKLELDKSQLEHASPESDIKLYP